MSYASQDVSSGLTIAADSASLEDPLRTIRRYLSAIVLDYSDPLSAELSDKRLLNRLDELAGFATGVNLATDSVKALADQVRQMAEDRKRTTDFVRAPAASGSTIQETNNRDILDMIAARFGPIPSGVALQVAAIIDAAYSNNSSNSTGVSPSNYTPARVGPNEAYVTPTRLVKSPGAPSTEGLNTKNKS
jgi:hypothetical protein